MEKLTTLAYETTGRIARMPVNQLMMMKLPLNQSVTAQRLTFKRFFSRIEPADSFRLKGSSLR